VTPPKITPPDTRAPIVSAPAITPQFPLRSGTLLAWMTCKFEACRVAVKTSFRTTTGRRLTVRLSWPARSLVKGRRTHLVLKLTKPFRTALGRRLPNRRSKLTLPLTFTVKDQAGNTTVRVVKVVVRR